MQWQSHLRIAEWVGTELNFSKPDLLEVADGSVAPDKWWDHAFHHNHKYLERKMSLRIIKARQLFLTHNAEYFREIGIALHYIADRLIPQTSYLRHINIEEEVAKISQSRQESNHRGSKENCKKYTEEMKKKIEELDVTEEEKTLLLDPAWTNGKRNTLTLALTNLPPYTDAELLYNIACRISIGVTQAIISTDPPHQLLWEKHKFATQRILNFSTRLKFYALFIISMPLLFFIYGEMGVVAYFLTLLVNSLSLIPVILTLKRTNKIQKYLIFRDHSRILFAFFVLVSLVAFGYKLLLAGVVVVSLALVQLPKIVIDKEIEDEIPWYTWD